MVIDVEERCRSLGIKRSDYHEAVKLSGRMLYEALESDSYGVDEYIDIIKSLPEKPMVAMIRYDGLYRRYPKVFDFDGPIPGVEAPYPYAGRED